MTKTLGLKEFKDGVMLNFVEGFFKIKLQDDHLLFRVMAQVKIFKGPSQAILDGYTFDEAMLISMNEGDDQLLQPIGKELGD